MSTSAAPTAATVSVQQMLELLDGHFAALAEGVAKGQYALWLGSGVSRDRLDDLKEVVARVLTHLRERINAANPACPYRRALDEALDLAQLPPANRASIDYAHPISEWPAIDTVLRNLSTAYDRLLDIRIEGQPDDYLLWEAVDVPNTFAPKAATPDCEHICIAILVLEGVLPDIASANWDGLIEAAVYELTHELGAALRVCAHANDLREPLLLSRLLKFHGCAIRAAANSAVYRPLLIARHSQITDWPANGAYAAIREELTRLATTKPSLMIGLSGQDSNIQHVFALAKERLAWEWPCDPPAHVFAEDMLGQDQLNILRVVYHASYANHRAAIERSALLRGYAKPTLTALVLHVLCAKARSFALTVDAPHIPLADRAHVEEGLVHLRNRMARQADADRLAFVRALVSISSRAMALFQTGAPTVPRSHEYRPLSKSPVHLIVGDAGLATSGIREMVFACGLLGLGDHEGIWNVNVGDAANEQAGALELASQTGLTRIFFAANERASVQLEINSIVTRYDSDAVVVHSTKPVAPMARSPRARFGRTGRLGLREVGIRELLADASNFDELRLRFREEMAL